MWIIGQIRKAAAAQPDAIAIRAESAELTYSELIQRVDGLADDLRGRGIGPKSRVAIYLDRSPELIVAILATISAGAAYIPLDTEFPPLRLSKIIEDSDPQLILSRINTPEGLIPLGIPALQPSRWSIVGSGVDTPGRSPTYLIYTSGSTGRPKGVVVGQASLRNYLSWAIDALPFGRGGVPLFASIGFDHAVTCYFPPLMMGDCLILLPPLLGGRNLAAGLLNGRHYSYVKITPSHLRLLDADARAELGRSAELVMFGGERVTASLIADVRRDCPMLRVMNHYGPTEATVGCCVHDIPPGPLSDPIPIGRPLPGVDAFIRGENGEPAADGETGELLIGGNALARGYWGSPEQTARMFIRRSDHKGRIRRWYRTGDLSQRTVGGDFLYLGRNDDQLKIFGHRIELAEVEAALRSYPGIHQASVLAVDVNEVSVLVAAVSAPEPKPSESDVRAHLRASLPSVMVPRRILIFDQLPLGVGGKLDREGIVRLAVERDAQLPSATVEEIVARKFSEALGQPMIRAEDDFFELGGDSLATVEIAVSLREHFGIPLEPTALFDYPTIDALASHIRSYVREDLHHLG